MRNEEEEEEEGLGTGDWGLGGRLRALSR